MLSGTSIYTSDGVSLRLVVVRIVKRRDEWLDAAGAVEGLGWRRHAENRVRICEFCLEPKLICDVFQTIASVVNVNFIKNCVVKFVEVWTTRRFLKWYPVGDERNKASAPVLSAAESVGISIVSQWIGDD